MKVVTRAKPLGPLEILPSFARPPGDEGVRAYVCIAKSL